MSKEVQREVEVADLSETDALIAEFKRDPERRRLLLESEISIDLSERMKAIRKSRGLSQVNLAERVGCTQSFIAKLEAGAYDRMGLSNLRTFARAMGFDITVDSMFYEIPESAFTGRSSCRPLQQAHELQEALSGRLATLSLAKWDGSGVRIWSKGEDPETVVQSEAETAA